MQGQPAPFLVPCMCSIRALLPSFLSQGCDGGRDPPAAGHPDGLAGPAGRAEDLSPGDHPLHCGDVDPAVHDRDHRPRHPGVGGLTESVRAWMLVGLGCRRALVMCCLLEAICLMSVMHAGKVPSHDGWMPPPCPEAVCIWRDIRGGGEGPQPSGPACTAS